MTLRVNAQGSKGAFRFSAQLEAQPGQVTALFGPSGCGKTSLLRSIAGLDPLDAGEVLCDNETWDAPGIHVAAHRRHAAMVFQRPTLFPHLGVQANLQLAHRYRRPGEGVPLNELVEVFELQPLLARRPAGLSGGEAQRVLLARALASNPRLLLLDEPLAGLDRWRKQEILPYLSALKSRVQIPLLYVSHSLDEVAALADEMVLMQEGKTLEQGGVTAMLRSTVLQQNMHGDEFSLLDAESYRRDEQRQLLLVTSAGGFEFLLPLPAAPVGEGLRLQIRSRDVSLCLDRPAHSSILNILPVQVAAVRPEPQGGQCLVDLSLGKSLLVARISRWSCEQLQLRPGLQVFAQVKAASLARS